MSVAILLLPIVVFSSPNSARRGGIMDLVQDNLRDVSFTAKVVHGNQEELQKINSDFGKAYRFEYAKIKLKDPFMVRAESVVDDQSVLIINNGSVVLYKVPKAGIRSRQDLRDSPGRRQTFLDFGLLTSSLFEGLFATKYIRSDRASGDAVFDLTYRQERANGDTSRHRIWVDRDRKIVRKREWYNQEGVLLATFIYGQPKLVHQVWIPTDVVVKNAEGKVAGETSYEGITANQGLSDSLFRTN